MTDGVGEIHSADVSVMGVHLTFGMRQARAPPHFRGVLSTLHTGHMNMRGFWYLARTAPAQSARISRFFQGHEDAERVVPNEAAS